MTITYKSNNLIIAFFCLLITSCHSNLSLEGVHFTPNIAIIELEKIQKNKRWPKIMLDCKYCTPYFNSYYWQILQIEENGFIRHKYINTKKSVDGEFGIKIQDLDYNQVNSSSWFYLPDKDSYSLVTDEKKLFNECIQNLFSKPETRNFTLSWKEKEPGKSKDNKKITKIWYYTEIPKSNKLKQVRVNFNFYDYESEVRLDASSISFETIPVKYTSQSELSNKKDSLIDYFYDYSVLKPIIHNLKLEANNAQLFFTGRQNWISKNKSYIQFTPNLNGKFKLKLNLYTENRPALKDIVISGKTEIESCSLNTVETITYDIYWPSLPVNVKLVSEQPDEFVIRR